MADTPQFCARVEPEIAEAARRALGIPATASAATVLRAALAVAAGIPRRQAVRQAYRRVGPKREDAA